MAYSDKISFLFGNGIGLSINDENFLLSTGIKHAWEKLNDEEKKFIKELVKLTQNQSSKEIDGIPVTEDNLSKLHELILALQDICDIVEETESLDPNKFLNPDYLDYVKTNNKFIFYISEYFFEI